MNGTKNNAKSLEMRKRPLKHIQFGMSYTAYHLYSLYRSCGNTEVKREQISLALFFVPLVLKGPFLRDDLRILGQKASWYQFHFRLASRYSHSQKFCWNNAF